MGYSPWGYKESDMTKQLSSQARKKDMLLNDKFGRKICSQNKSPKALLPCEGLNIQTDKHI